MDVAVCYSGGKDSTLAALALDRFYDVRLVTGRFGVTDDWTAARDAADRLGFPFETVDLDRDVADQAVERIHEEGHPSGAIQQVHEHALEVVAGLDVDAVADGTRRDDRVPRLSLADARSLEDRHGVDYLVPLAGVGHGAVDEMATATLDVERGPTERIPRGDYEAELRALLAEHHGDGAVEAAFPDHVQTYVRGLAGD